MTNSKAISIHASVDHPTVEGYAAIGIAFGGYMGEQTPFLIPPDGKITITFSKGILTAIMEIKDDQSLDKKAV